MKNDPALLARRVNNTEKEQTQKFIHFFINLVFVAASVVSALDHRFGWSAVPTYGVVAGDVLVALGMLIIFFVFRENTFTASTVQVAAGQKVISTGFYALVRHPMYVGGLVFIFGIPLALGSWWGLLTFIPLTLLIVWRILDEERFLVKNLQGYGEYRSAVKYRLIPFVSRNKALRNQKLQRNRRFLIRGKLFLPKFLKPRRAVGLLMSQQAGRYRAKYSKFPICALIRRSDAW